MKTFFSPYNYLIKTKDFGYILFVGITGNIYPINLKDYLYYKYSPFLSIQKKKELIEYGILLDEKPQDYILRAQTKALKDLSNFRVDLVIVPTNGCNLACPYCFQKDNVKNNFITKKTIDKIIHFIGTKSNQFDIEWYGGEPSLYPDIIEYFYLEAQKAGYEKKCSLLITNGTFKNIKIWDIIEKYINQIQITIDGLEEYHDSRRKYKNGSGTFNEIIGNLDILYNKINEGKIVEDLDVIIRCNIDKFTKNQYIELREFILDRYNSRFRLQPARVLETDKNEYNTDMFTEKEYEIWKESLFYEYGILEEPYLPAENIRFNQCNANNPNSYTFDTEGNIYKCSRDLGLNNRIIGNCNYSYRNRNNIENKYLFGTYTYLPKKCEECKLIFFCWGGCLHSRLFKSLKKTQCKSQIYNLKNIIRLCYRIKNTRNKQKSFRLL